MQSALRHSPGNHSAVVLYNVNKEDDRDALSAAAARLIRYFSDPVELPGTEDRFTERARAEEGARLALKAAQDHAKEGRHDEAAKAKQEANVLATKAAGMAERRRTPGDVHVLVGFGLEHVRKSKLASLPDRAHLDAADGLFTGLDVQHQPADVFIQVSAWNEGDRLFALRMVRQALRGLASLKGEFLGNMIRDGEEPFGFSDGAPTREARDSVAAGAAGSWLLFQHYRQNVADFFAKSVPDRVKLMGRPPAGMPEAEANTLTAEANNPEGHANRMQEYRNTLLRRGFPCQRDGEEGLAFVGVTAEPSILGRALRRYVGHQHGDADPLKFYTPVTHSSLYFCPTNDFGEGELKPEDAAESMRNPLDLIAYEMPLAAYYYMAALTSSNTFLQGDANMGHDLTDRTKAELDKIEQQAANDPAVLAHFNKQRAANLPKLTQADVAQIVRGLREAAKDDANKINELLRKYFTIA